MSISELAFPDQAYTTDFFLDLRVPEEGSAFHVLLPFSCIPSRLSSQLRSYVIGLISVCWHLYLLRLQK